MFALTTSPKKVGSHRCQRSNRATSPTLLWINDGRGSDEESDNSRLAG